MPMGQPKFPGWRVADGAKEPVGHRLLIATAVGDADGDHALPIREPATRDQHEEAGGVGRAGIHVERILRGHDGDLVGAQPRLGESVEREGIRHGPTATIGDFDANLIGDAPVSFFRKRALEPTTQHGEIG